MSTAHDHDRWADAVEDGVRDDGAIRHPNLAQLLLHPATLSTRWMVPANVAASSWGR